MVTNFLVFSPDFDLFVDNHQWLLLFQVVLLVPILQNNI